LYTGIKCLYDYGVAYMYVMFITPDVTQ